MLILDRPYETFKYEVVCILFDFGEFNVLLELVYNKDFNLCLSCITICIT